LQSFGKFGSVTQWAVERRIEPCRPLRGVEHPRSELEGRTVSNVLAMTARKLCDPIALLVTVVAGDISLHGNSALLFAK
jgi:hypothetical protein